MKVGGSIWRIAGRGLRVLIENDDELLLPSLLAPSIFL